MLFNTELSISGYPGRNDGAVVVSEEAGGMWCPGSKEMGRLEWDMEENEDRFPISCACLRSYGRVWEPPRFENLGCAAV